MAREEDLIGHLIEFYDKGLDPLSISSVVSYPMASSLEWKNVEVPTVVTTKFIVQKS